MIDKFAAQRDEMKWSSAIRERRIEQLARLYALPQYGEAEVSPFDDGAADIELFFESEIAVCLG